jgi:hypothetical protein
MRGFKTGMIRKFALTFFIIPGTVFQQLCNAMPVTVTAKADTTQIRIGEQFHLNLSATVGPGTKIIFPFLTDTFNHFEVVNKGKIDTVSSAGKNTLTLTQQLTVTSFDSGYFVIPPFSFVIKESPVKSDTVLTEAMLMSVRTIPVDTTKEIKTIKPIMDVPFPWMDYLLYAVITAIAVVLIIYLVRRFSKKEVIMKAPVIRERPAHEIALEGLRRIEDEKIWQQGLTKKYYSEVADVLRQYIERRFEINAMEQTTDEILIQFSKSILHDADMEKLRFILMLADMVKFAKALPLPTENEKIMQYAYAFVNDTRPVVKEDMMKEEVIQ